MADDDPSDVASERFFEAVLGDASARPPDRRQPGDDPEAVTRDAVLEALSRELPRAGPRDHRRRRRRPRRARRAASPQRSARAGWDLSVEAAPVAAPATRRHDLIERGSPLVVVKRPIEQANIIARRAGPRRRRRAPRDPERAQLRSSAAGCPAACSRRSARSAVSPTPSTPSRRSYSDAGHLRPLRRMLARQGRAGRPSSCSASSRGLAEGGVTRRRAARAPSGSSAGHPPSPSKTPTPACRGSAAARSPSASSSTSTSRCAGCHSSRPTMCRNSPHELAARPVSIAAVGTVPTTCSPASHPGHVRHTDITRKAPSRMAHYLYLVRHGEQQDAEHGLPDGPLSPKGKRQARPIAERLGRRAVHRAVPLAAAARGRDRRDHDRADARARSPQPSALLMDCIPSGPTPDMPHAFEPFFGAVTPEPRSTPGRRRWRMRSPSSSRRRAATATTCSSPTTS